jgi:N-acetylglucosaminyl-diphospho-decaprenol L-rhamnosyltransferase
VSVSPYSGSPRWDAMTATVTVVYVNFHCEHLIERSIHALMGSPSQTEFDILVVDNGSSQNATFWSRLPVRYFPSAGNVGFGKACNHGASHSEAEFVLFLNPDTVPKRGLVDSLVKHMSSHPEASACGPALIDAGGRPVVYWVYHHLLSWEVAESLYLQGLWRKVHQSRMMRRFGKEKFWPTVCLSGACLFLRRGLFDKVGGFDARFFLNFEDIELCRRLNKHGALHFLPFLHLVHEEGSAQRADLGEFVYHRLDAHRIFIDIAQHGWRWIAARAILLLSTCLRLVVGGVFLRGKARTRLFGYRKALGSTLQQRTT